MTRFYSRISATALAGMLAIVATGDRAHAQGATFDDPRLKKADQLFDEGKQLLDSNLAQACAKFEESFKLNGEAIGTLVNVALCDEKLGKFATAVARFTETLERAKEQGLPQYVRAAEQHLADLAPLVPHVTIKLSESLAGTSIVLDNQVVPAGGLASIAVDPGEREIVVSAPDRLPYRTKIIIGKSERKDVVVPALAKSVVVTSSRRRIGQIAAIAGVVGAGIGLGIGLYARGQYNDQFKPDGMGDLPCTKTESGRRCSPDGLQATNSARTLGNVGTIVGIAGAAVAVGGVVLWLVSPGTIEPAAEQHAGLRVVPEVSPDQVGLVAVGRF